MSHVSGPCRSLPGSRHAVPEGTCCDYHPDKIAVARIQGETDSFGAEFDDLCAECLAEYNVTKDEDRGGTCDWCHCDMPNLRPRRDYDEGMCGPVYFVCDACRRSDDQRIAEEEEDADEIDEWEEWL